MDLSKLTDDQRASVTCLDGPLLISAGAGSGKTYTLTQRIVYALMEESGPALTDVEEVLAITFTDRAASELKGRIRKELRAQGLSAQALKVDEAWISTIHAACSRMLRARALELGIDPAFTVIEQSTSDMMLEEALETTLDAARLDETYTLLFEEYPPRSQGFSPDSVAAFVNTIIGKVREMPGGFDSLDLGPQTGIREVARAFLSALEEALVVYQAADSKAESFLTSRASAEAAYADISELLARDGRGAAAGGVSAIDAATIDAATAATIGPDVATIDAEATSATIGSVTAAPATSDDADFFTGAFLDILDGFKEMPGNVGNAEVRAATASEKQAFHRACACADLAHARRLLDSLVELAKATFCEYQRQKDAQGFLDYSDLLTLLPEAFERDPAFAADAAERFKLVMVDEFQDTSQLQIDFLRGFAGEGGVARLCTVGDTQQSIYRFRGADVNVYARHKDEMRACGAESRVLKKNFRSHADILAFVQRIFGQESVFGDDLIPLEAARSEAGAGYHAAGKIPRIDFVLVTSETSKGSIADRLRVEAHAIARRFKAFQEAGHVPGDMVLLLGKMSNAPLFADALRAEGFECVISKGSTFKDLVEVQLVNDLLRCLAEPADTQALFNVLTSSLFALTARELAELCESEEGPYRKLAPTFDAERIAARRGDDSPLVFALGLLADARRRIGNEPAFRVVHRVLVESGWVGMLDDAGARGTAICANVLKALRKVEAIEADGALGIAQVSRAFAALVDKETGVNDKPGTLMAETRGVIEIMTVHASKGLEFPIVAVAAMEESSRSSKLQAETLGRTTYLALRSKGLLDRYPNRFKRGADAAYKDLDPSEPLSLESADPCVRMQAIRQLQEVEESAEAQRKFYVAVTRAREALVIAGQKTTGRASGYKGFLRDIQTAFYPDGDFPIGVDHREYGGSEPAVFERIQIRCEGGGESGGQASTEQAMGGTIPQVQLAEGQASVEQATGGQTPAGRSLLEQTARGQAPRLVFREGELDYPVDALVPPTAAPCSARRRGGEPPLLVDEPLRCAAPVGPRDHSYSSIAAGLQGQVGTPEGEAALEGLSTAGEPAGSGEFGSQDETRIMREQAGDADLVHDEDEGEERICATDFGSAFHMVAEYLVRAGVLGVPELAHALSAAEASTVDTPSPPSSKPTHALSAAEASAEDAFVGDVPAGGRSVGELPTGGARMGGVCTEEAGTTHDGPAVPSCPEEFAVHRARIDAILRAHGVFSDMPERERFRIALKRWLTSDVCARATRYPRLAAEVPFLVPIGDSYLQGEIDLLCTDPASSEAFVIDYKTGGSAAETQAQLQAKHRLQALCYAYALICVGYTAVEMVFVRVEQGGPGGDDEPETVAFGFTADQKAALSEEIGKAIGAAST